MKRTTMNSDIDSDCDEVFAEDSKGTINIQDDEGNPHILNRKRRRGIIEKRRRDRINSSLTELRRLVPTAFEKQGSAKLEKAEILQLTVDHLKILHSKGEDPFYLEAQQFSMDYHGVGFRECAAEVARYLVGMEGMDLQDPLRMRLLSHLQCFAAQRELAIKSATSSIPWSPLFSSLPPAVHSSHQYQQIQRPSATKSPYTTSSSGSSTASSRSESHSGKLSTVSSLSSTSSDIVSSPRLSSSAASSSSPLALTHRPRNIHIPSPTAISLPTSPATSPFKTRASENSSSLSHFPTKRYSTEPNYGTAFQSAPIHHQQSSSVRPPYRPWGTEVAY